jgi:hypothetical protein
MTKARCLPRKMQIKDGKLLRFKASSKIWTNWMNFSSITISIAL